MKMASAPSSKPAVGEVQAPPPLLLSDGVVPAVVPSVPALPDPCEDIDAKEGRAARPEVQRSRLCENGAENTLVNAPCSKRFLSKSGDSDAPDDTRYSSRSNSA